VISKRIFPSQLSFGSLILGWYLGGAALIAEGLSLEDGFSSFSYIGTIKEHQMRNLFHDLELARAIDLENQDALPFIN